MSVELRVVSQDTPAANREILALLRNVMRRVREGEVQSIAVAYIAGPEVSWDYVCEDGEELNLSCVCRHLDELLRHDAFGED